MKNILLHEGNIFLVYQVLGRSQNAKDWFRFASDRKGGRKRRAEKKRKLKLIRNRRGVTQRMSFKIKIKF